MGQYLVIFHGDILDQLDGDMSAGSVPAANGRSEWRIAKAFKIPSADIGGSPMLQIANLLKKSFHTVNIIYVDVCVRGHKTH